MSGFPKKLPVPYKRLRERRVPSLFAGGCIRFARFQLADIGRVKSTDALQGFLHYRRHLITGDVNNVI